jgi:hypothetical protein
MVDGISSMSYPKCINDLKSKNIESSVGTVHNRKTDFLEKANREEAKIIGDHENQGL